MSANRNQPLLPKGPPDAQGTDGNDPESGTNGPSRLQRLKGYAKMQMGMSTIEYVARILLFLVYAVMAIVLLALSVK
jgi:hypothetical protein